MTHLSICDEESPEGLPSSACCRYSLLHFKQRHLLGRMLYSPEPLFSPVLDNLPCDTPNMSVPPKPSNKLSPSRLTPILVTFGIDIGSV